MQDNDDEFLLAKTPMTNLYSVQSKMIRFATNRLFLSLRNYGNV